MTYGNIARPYPETVEALERENAELKRRVDSIAEYSRAQHASRIAELEQQNEALRLRLQGKCRIIEEMARQDGERIAALEAEVERLGRSLGLNATDRRFIRAFNAEPTGQHDLPPTRAETEANEERQE